MSDAKVLNTTSEDVKKSVASIYSDLLGRRRAEKENKEEQKRLEREAKKAAKEAEKEAESKTQDGDENKPLSKKEKAEAALDSWKETIVGLTGDDLEYIKPKKNKKKYKKWIDEDGGDNTVLTAKPTKRKKRNYRKEFEPEINMLKAIVTDQNKFTVDLQKRYQNSAGPATKDAMPLNKTQVELASVINAARSNSLGVLNAIGNLKKTIADLYMKQIKLDGESSGGGFDNQDLSLLGSSMAQSMFGNAMATKSVGSIDDQPLSMGGSQSPVINSGVPITPQAAPQGEMQFPKFNPDTWDGGGLNSGSTKYEAIPHKVVVELHKADNKARFKAVRNDNGEELIGAPVPTCSITTMDLKSNVAKDAFDQVYQLEVIE